MSNQPVLPPEIARRRTFAIISHPDAGKTTLTEKFLLYGGAIQMAGQVRAKGEARRTRSDLRDFTVPATSMALPISSSFSVMVVLPASGWEMMAKVRRFATSAAWMLMLGNLSTQSSYCQKRRRL